MGGRDFRPIGGKGLSCIACVVAVDDAATVMAPANCNGPLKFRNSGLVLLLRISWTVCVTAMGCSSTLGHLGLHSEFTELFKPTYLMS